MGKFSFQSIVVETDQVGKLKIITSVEDAATFLQNYWPGKRGPHYLEARVACFEAMEGLISVDDARVAIVEAAIEADIYAREGR